MISYKSRQAILLVIKLVTHYRYLSWSYSSVMLSIPVAGNEFVGSVPREKVAAPFNLQLKPKLKSVFSSQVKSVSHLTLALRPEGLFCGCW